MVVELGSSGECATGTQTDRQLVFTSEPTFVLIFFGFSANIYPVHLIDLCLQAHHWSPLLTPHICPVSMASICGRTSKALAVAKLPTRELRCMPVLFATSMPSSLTLTTTR